MRKYRLTALLATSPANVFYLSDLCPFGSCYALLPCDRNLQPAIVSPISGVAPVVLMSVPWIDDVRYYGEFYVTINKAKEPLTDAERRLVECQKSWERKKQADPFAILLEILKERGITKGRIGVDETNLPRSSLFWQEISSLSDLEIVRAQDIFKEIRMVKSREEVRRIQEAIRITEDAWGTALDQAREGMTEREFAEIYERTIISEAGRVLSKNGMYGAPIAFGRRTAFPDIAFPSEDKLRKGNIIRLDGGCTYMGYPCDIGRSAILGQPSEKLRKYYRALMEGEQLALDMAQAGVKASTIFNAVVQKVRKSGIPHYTRHHTGHSWGIERYEPPLISPKSDAPLEAGMIMCFETPYYEVGWGGPIVEDVVTITESRPNFLTKFSRELRIIDI